jgi:hypothetical protein
MHTHLLFKWFCNFFKLFFFLEVSFYTQQTFSFKKKNWGLEKNFSGSIQFLKFKFNWVELSRNITKIKLKDTARKWSGLTLQRKRGVKLSKSTEGLRLDISDFLSSYVGKLAHIIDLKGKEGGKRRPWCCRWILSFFRVARLQTVGMG